jgi:cytoskeletal protein RodZ
MKPFMSVEQLGKTLTQARTARGLTLHDVERDTRISGKYLQALEHGELETLPAPVYARAFMRTYAQYLGLNAREFVSELPGAKPEPELPPLPDVTHEGRLPLVSASWLIAGVVVVIMVIVGMVMLWNRNSDTASTVRTGPPQTQRAVSEGSDNPLPTAGPQPVVVQSGQVPDVRGQQALIGIHAVSEAGLRFFVIEVKNSKVDKETIFQQSPSPGTSVDEGSVVTLMISR